MRNFKIILSLIYVAKLKSKKSSNSVEKGDNSNKKRRNLSIAKCRNYANKRNAKNKMLKKL